MAFSFSNANNTTFNLQAALRGQLITRAQAAPYIAQLWSAMIRRELEDKMDFLSYFTNDTYGLGSAGDRVNIRTIGRLGENIKVPGVPVTLQSPQMANFPIILDRHVESSFSVEDIVHLLLPNGMPDATLVMESAYALRRGVMAQALSHRAATQSIAGSSIVSSANGTFGAGSGVSSPLDLNGIMRAKTLLNQRRYTDDGLVLFVSPVQYSQLLSNQRLQNQFFAVNSPEAGTREGIVGRIFGIPVYMTTLLSPNNATGFTNGSTVLPTPGFNAGGLYYPTQEPTAPAPLSAAVAFDPATNPTVDAQVVSTAWLVHKEYLAAVMPYTATTKIEDSATYISSIVVNHLLYGMRTWRQDAAVNIHTNNLLPTMTAQF